MLAVMMSPLGVTPLSLPVELTVLLLGSVIPRKLSTDESVAMKRPPAVAAATNFFLPPTVPV